MPRPTHTKQDPAKVEAFRAELCEKLHSEQIALESSVHLWVSDDRVPRKWHSFYAGGHPAGRWQRQMRFGLQPVTRRVWARRGVQVVLPVEPRYQWGYTYGALEVCGDGAEFAVAAAPPCGLPSAGCLAPLGSAHRRGEPGGQPLLSGANRAERTGGHAQRHPGRSRVPSGRGSRGAAGQRPRHPPATLQPGTQPRGKAMGRRQRPDLQPSMERPRRTDGSDQRRPCRILDHPGKGPRPHR